MQPCLRPAPLQPGDLLYVIAPSGALREGPALEQGLQIWRDRGYRLKLCPGYDERWGYLAGTDQARRHQLQLALDEPSCRGLVCLRGGYGGARLLEAWQWPQAVKPTASAPADPSAPWLIGFSDITSLLWSLACRGVSGVHGPLLTTLSAEPNWSVERLFDWLEGRGIAPLSGKSWVGGEASGLLLPANLTVATHLLGTSAQPDLTNTILALEDVTEAPYRIDRMLTQWRMTGALNGVRGIAVGRFSQCEPAANLPSFTVEEVLRDRLSDLGIPIVADLPFGHDGVNAALPVGLPVTLDGDRGLLKFEPA
ncbi:MAG: LD-carboxypeptidase [Elainella sp.]